MTQISIFGNDEVKEMIEIRHFFTDWHEVTRERAQKFVAYIIPQMTALSITGKIEFIESKWLRGITVAELFQECSICKKREYCNSPLERCPFFDEDLKKG